jgi:hypothetical protein
MNDIYTPGPWRPGKPGTVVADASTVVGFEDMNSGHTAVDYYGGNLVAESILMQGNINLISAAPEMLEALKNIENDNGSIPEPLWNLIQTAIAKAEGRL